MKDKIVLVTGATDGIGKQTALELAQMGATVLVHGRSSERGLRTLEEIQQKTGNSKLYFYKADLSLPSDTRRMAVEIKNKWDRLDVLLHNAGVFMKQKQLNALGWENTFAVNHMAPFILTQDLLGLVEQAKAGRVITVSSIAHQRGVFDVNNLQAEKEFSDYGTYALSKLCNVLFTYHLDKLLRQRKSRVTANCLHPGVINTKLLVEGFGRVGSEISEGSKTSVFLASSEKVAAVSGKYFIRLDAVESSASSYKTDHQKCLWEISTGLASMV